jgi:hypothetical protein
VSGQQWSENRLGPFAPKNPRFPLPGNVGLPVDKKEKKMPTPTSTRSLVDVFLEASSEDSQKIKAIGSFLENLEAEKLNSNDTTVSINCLSLS